MARLDLKGLGGATLGASQQGADQTIEHADGGVGETSGALQNDGGEDGASAQRRPCFQMLRRQSQTLPHQSATTVFVNAAEHLRIKSHGAKPSQLLDQLRQSATSGRTRRLARPRQRAKRHVGAPFEPFFHRLALRGAQARVDLLFDMAVGLRQRRRDHSFDDARFGRGDARRLNSSSSMPASAGPLTTPSAVVVSQRVNAS